MQHKCATAHTCTCKKASPTGKACANNTWGQRDACKYFTKFEKLHLLLVVTKKSSSSTPPIKEKLKMLTIILRRQDQVPGGGCSGRTDARLITSCAMSIRAFAFSPKCLARSPPEALPWKSYRCHIGISYFTWTKEKYRSPDIWTYHSPPTINARKNWCTAKQGEGNIELPLSSRPSFSLYVKFLPSENPSLKLTLDQNLNIL